MAAPTIADNAVITQQEYLESVGKAKDNANIDNEQLIRLINQVSDFLEAHLRRKIRAPASAIAETITGITGSIYYVDNARITSVNTLEEFNMVDSAGAIDWDTRTIAQRPYEFVEDEGKFEFIDGHLFNNQRWRLTYETGWAVADVPGPIKTVAISMIQRTIKLMTSGMDGINSQNFGDQSTTYDLNQQLTSRHKTLLSRYRRI